MLIFNPQSTGDAPELAGEAARRAGRAGPGRCRSSWPRPSGPGTPGSWPASRPRSGGRWSVSVSGDGGYSEVVDGLMARPGGEPAVAAVLAAGNAQRPLPGHPARRPLADAIDGPDGDPDGPAPADRRASERAVGVTRTSGSGSPRLSRSTWRRAARGRCGRSSRSARGSVAGSGRSRWTSMDGGRVRLDSLGVREHRSDGEVRDAAARTATRTTGGRRGHHDRAHGEAAGPAHRAAGGHRRPGQQPPPASYRFRTVCPDAATRSTARSSRSACHTRHVVSGHSSQPSLTLNSQLTSPAAGKSAEVHLFGARTVRRRGAPCQPDRRGGQRW